MTLRTVDSGEVTEQLLALGVRPGGVLVVHTAFSRVAPVEGGPIGLDDDDHPFDPKETPCPGMGVVAATGPRAAEITAAHPVDVPHGLDSPIGRVYELDGQVLLLGVGHDADTTVHLAENMAGVRYRRPTYSTVLRGGQPTRCDYAEIDHCCQNFNRLDVWLEAEGRQRRGVVGHAETRLARSRDIVDAAVARLRADETIFLHPAGLCGECDEARASLTPGAAPGTIRRVGARPSRPARFEPPGSGRPAGPLREDRS